ISYRMQISSNGLNQYQNHSPNLEQINSTKLATTGSSTTIGDLQAGTVFEGTISSVSNGKVTINLSNGQSMSARLDTGVSGIAEGQSLFFEVKSNEGGTVQIRPISNGLTGNPTLLNALNTAGISVNEKTLTMVDSMMKEQLPIDSDSLLAMNRSLLSNPDISPETLVLMNKLDIPVTTANVNMFEAYASNQARISEDINNLVPGLTDAVSDYSVSADKTIALNNSVVNALFSQEEIVSLSVNENVELPDLIKGQAAPLVGSPEFINVSDKPEIMTDSTEVITDNNKLPVGSVEGNASELPVSKEGEILKPSEQLMIKADIEQNLDSFLSPSEKQTFEKAVGEIKELPQLKEALLDENGQLKSEFTPKQAVKLISQLLREVPQNAIPDNIQRLIASEPYKKLLGQAIKDELSMNPKDVVKKGEVSEFFERVMNKTEKLTQIINPETVKDADRLLQSVSNIRENITFMNDANQIYNFVQIPLKMYNQTTESKLYVM
ncbi:MAG: hypothetical protein HUJ70_10490, partial [Pseudobutyrivibrio sp.]|nr:hypothetical protein [Pseudobutyrivibrio sp.]